MKNRTTANDYAELIDQMLEQGETEEIRMRLAPLLEAYHYARLYECVVEHEASRIIEGVDSR